MIIQGKSTGEDAVLDTFAYRVTTRVGDSNYFCLVLETLMRMGLCNDTENSVPIIDQQCHCWSVKGGDTYIGHYKALMSMRNEGEFEYTEHDMMILNQTVKLLQQWGFIQVLEEPKINVEGTRSVRIVRAADKGRYIFRSNFKY
ncbi:RegA [Vibrio phage YC]|uniref:Translation repressor protein n=1 Tax=Vibrio phage YC TaxID=2267403 RepID=A0A384ZSB0_9CAUD|nr:RegA [Vibrio phage YC]AXC34504.1 RegA [Vibrio phage YC]